MSNINNHQNLVTIVTVNLNNSKGLENTIKSVLNQTYSNYEYLIIDGASTDSSLAVINSFSNKGINYISEADEGIYHAMNKAITLAEGDWLLFMNSGDIFFDRQSLAKAMSSVQQDTDVIFSDWVYINSEKYITASKETMTVRHQSVIYKKHLHEAYGTYVASQYVTISDYIFFLSIRNRKWVYNNNPLSKCDELGVSSNVSHFYQKITVDFIFKMISKSSLLLILILYPFYKILKNIWLQILK